MALQYTGLSKLTQLCVPHTILFLSISIFSLLTSHFSSCYNTPPMRRWLAHQGWGIWIGLALTLLAAILHWAGLTLRLELQAYDFYVRHFSRIPASDKIVHIDIDDDALARFES